MTDNAAHTKGPWTVGKSETRLPIKSGSRTVAYVQMSRRDWEDASLIAAAPEMLAALKQVLRAGCSDRDLVAAIIAKAEAAP